MYNCYLSQKLLSIFLEGLAGCGELAVNAFQSPAQDDDESTISNLEFNEGLPEIKLQLEELTRRVLCRFVSWSWHPFPPSVNVLYH